MYLTSSLEDYFSTFLSLKSQTFINTLSLQTIFVRLYYQIKQQTYIKALFWFSSLNLYILYNTKISYQTGFRVRHLTIKGLPEKQPSLNVLQVILLSQRKLTI